MEMYKMLSRDELKTIKAALEEEYAKAQSLGLKLDMSRGKPAPAQLDLAMGILSTAQTVIDQKTEPTAVTMVVLMEFLKPDILWLILWEWMLPM